MTGAVVGAPGTLPTNWVEGLSGLTREVIAIGTELGINYIDIKLSGTASGTVATISLESATQIVAANGEVWTNSAWFRTVAVPNPPLSYRLGVNERTSIGGFVVNADSSALSVTSTLTRFSFTRTLAGGGTVARVQPYVAFFLTNGATYDFTVRIGWPQMETGSVATSPIVTTAGTANRAADVVSLTGASSLIGQTSGTFFVEFDYTQNTAERRILSVTDGTVTNRLIVWTLNNILYFTANTGTSTVLLNPIPTGTNRVAVNYNISGGNTAIRASVNGGAIVTATQVATPVNLAEFDFGNREDNALSYNGRLRALSVFPTILADATLQSITTA
jgi:hypothetical protein